MPPKKVQRTRERDHVSDQYLLLSRLHPGEREVNWFAVAAAALFVVMFPFQTKRSRVAEYLGIAYHLLHLPIVATLPAPRWARAAGYGWLAIDTAIGGAAINGADADLVFAVRFGGHLLTATWIIAASYTAGGWTARVGIPLGISLGGLTLAMRWLPRWLFAPLGLLLVIWLLLVARGQRHESSREAAPLGE
jgi:hypothetical protein